jgi:hypothetical protein
VPERRSTELGWGADVMVRTVPVATDTAPVDLPGPRTEVMIPVRGGHRWAVSSETEWPHFVVRQRAVGRAVLAVRL